MSDSVREAVNAILPNGRSHAVYATTECGLIATDWLTSWKRGAVGSVLPNTQVRVVDEEGRPLGVGEEGELLVKKPFLFLVSTVKSKSRRAFENSVTEGLFGERRSNEGCLR